MFFDAETQNNGVLSVVLLQDTQKGKPENFIGRSHKLRTSDIEISSSID